MADGTVEPYRSWLAVLGNRKIGINFDKTFGTDAKMTTIISFSDNDGCYKMGGRPYQRTQCFLT